jgi:phage shock protein C
MMEERAGPGWMRAREGRIIAGVCAGFARERGVSPWLVRAIMLVALFATAGLVVIAYVIVAALLPVEPVARERE